MRASGTTKTTKRLPGIYLVISVLLFTYLLIEFWPTAGTEEAGQRGWVDTVMPHLRGPKP